MYICDLQDQLFGRGMTEAAIQIDPKGVQRLEERYQQDFNDNKSYLGFAMLFDGFVEQGPDTKAEAKAIADQLQLDLETIVHDHWLSGLRRDKVIELCKSLKKIGKKFVLCQGAEYTADEIAFDWNDMFPIFPIQQEEIS